MDITLLVLAAGIGSRFGGDKQLMGIGPAGETLLDYAIHDAARAGFDRVVLVLRTEIEDMLMGHVTAFHPGVEIVPVRQDELGPPRTKPWGTGHAVLSARDAVPGRFAMANADDFYGLASYEALAQHLRAGGPDEEWSLVGFQLADTLSSQGAVTRGLLRVDAQGFLASISEEKGVQRDDAGHIVTASAPDADLDPATPVSMNLWGFTPAIFELLHEGFATFRAEHDGDESAEYLVPDAVGTWVGESRARVRVLHSAASWFGLTHRDDVPAARAEIARLVAAGQYPPRLGTA